MRCVWIFVFVFLSIVCVSFVVADCINGPIISECACSGVNYTTGWCCSGIYFDPSYVDIYANICDQNFLYVDNQNSGCSDSRSRAQNSESSPWCTIGRAAWGSANRDSPNVAEAARAGDVVIIGEGIYDATQNLDTRWVPYYNPANSGNVIDGYITFQANGIVDLISSNDVGQGRPLIGTQARDYIVWDGFTLNENFLHVRADTGPVVVWDSEHVTLKNLHITGIDQGFSQTNHCGIRIEGDGGNNCNYITIQNCYITGFREDHGAAVMTYETDHAIFENNEITDCQNGLFAKGANNGPFIMRYNYIHDDVLKPINVGGVRSGGADIYQNIIHDSTGSGIQVHALGSDGPQNIRFVNNIIVDAEHAEYGGIAIVNDAGGVSNVDFYNNIIVGSNTAALTVAADTVSEVESDYNCVYNNDADFKVGSSTFILAQWFSAYGDDGHSIDSDPDFVDVVNHNYKLNPGSPCENTGLDVLDLDNDGSTTDSINMGAYITGNEVIGIIDYANGYVLSYECSDSLDNDNDGHTDYPSDPGCSSLTDNDESGLFDDVCEDDLDCDGFDSSVDCDDNDSSVWAEINCSYDGNVCGNFSVCGLSCPVVPEEICGNGVDEDCDGEDLVCGSFHDADLDENGVVSVGELGDYIDRWLVGGVSIGEVMGAINAWLH